MCEKPCGHNSIMSCAQFYKACKHKILLSTDRIGANKFEFNCDVWPLLPFEQLIWDLTTKHVYRNNNTVCWGTGILQFKSCRERLKSKTQVALKNKLKGCNFTVFNFDFFFLIFRCSFVQLSKNFNSFPTSGKTYQQEVITQEALHQIPIMHLIKPSSGPHNALVCWSSHRR